MIRALLACFVLATALSAQPISAGLKFGVPLTDAFSIRSPNPLSYVSDTRRYTVGPFIELRLPANLAIEIDALYRSYEFRATASSNPAVRANSWEFPVLGKYRFRSGVVQPYIEGGVSFSRLTDIPDVIELRSKNNYGVVVGAGIELHLGLVRISPEIRYSGFTRRFFNSPGDSLQSNRNQATVLVGISF